MVALPESILWFDYETFGLSPVWDRPAQFACLRTNAQLEPIEAPRVLWCRPPTDYLPSPEACRITGQSPMQLLREGLAEPDFIEQVVGELGRPGTCFVGYNSLRFDDEVTRHTLFRNFHDPYSHEWRDGNSRWDLLDVIRLARALRPEGMRWPVTEQGRATNRLEDLSRANGLEHAHAHDALSDVYATLAVARLLREHQPRLYDYAFANRDKASLQKALDPARPRIQLLVSGRVPADRSHVALVLPLQRHPINRNATIVLDLARHPSCLTGLTAADIAQRLFRPNDTTSAESGSADAARLPLISLALNKCPVVVPLNTLRATDAQRLGIDVAQQRQHARACDEVIDTACRDAIAEAFSSQPPAGFDDVEGTLYSGAFFSDTDRQRFDRIRRATPDELVGMTGHFDDTRCDELLFRYRARHFPETLSAQERESWQAQVRARLSDDSAPWLNWARFHEQLHSASWTGLEQKRLLEELERYARQLRDTLETSLDA